MLCYGIYCAKHPSPTMMLPLAVKCLAKIRREYPNPVQSTWCVHPVSLMCIYSTTIIILFCFVSRRSFIRSFVSNKLPEHRHWHWMVKSTTVMLKKIIWHPLRALTQTLVHHPHHSLDVYALCKHNVCELMYCVQHVDGIYFHYFDRKSYAKTRKFRRKFATLFLSSSIHLQRCVRVGYTMFQVPTGPKSHFVLRRS